MVARELVAQFDWSDPLDAYLDPLRNYARIQGRSAPSRFWVFALVNFVAINLLMQLDIMLGWTFSNDSFGYLSTALAVAVLVPSLSAAVRRLHDAGSEGLLLLLLLVPFIGGIIVFFLLIRSSRRGPNRYGPDPTGWTPAAPTVDGGMPVATPGKGNRVDCPWCGKTNPLGRDTCQWCHKGYRDPVAGHV